MCAANKALPDPFEVDWHITDQEAREREQEEENEGENLHASVDSVRSGLMHGQQWSAWHAVYLSWAAQAGAHTEAQEMWRGGERTQRAHQHSIG